MAKKITYAADFETNNSEDCCRVWAWGVHNINHKKDNITYGTNMDSFMEFLKDHTKKKIELYFHNLKFDGNFIISYLLKNGFTHSDNKTPGHFNILVDDMLTFYFIKIYLVNKNGETLEVNIRDSFKKIPLKISQMPKAYGLKGLEKGNLDDNEEEGYDKIREEGHELTETELEYLKNDVLILSKVLKIHYNQGMTALTMASDAMNTYQEIMTKRMFESIFTPISFNVDQFMRQAYLGGYTYCEKPQHVGEGLVFDVNSLYPSVMYSKIGEELHLYPHGTPNYFKGKYVYDTNYPLYIQHFKASFCLKPGKLPTIQDRATSMVRYSTKSTYITEQLEEAEFYLTHIDLELLLDHYDIYSIEYIDGYKMQGLAGVFDPYINHFMKMKIENDDNPAMRTIAKRFLNSLYGKYGTSFIRRNKIPELDENTGKVKYITETHQLDNGTEVDFKIRNAYRVDVASYCTAYARRVTINAAQKMKDEGRFCYADTDSIHITGKELPTNIKIDPTALGLWKHESTFEKAIFIRRKTYAEYINGGWDIKCAGMTQAIKDFIKDMDNFEDVFKIGFNTDNCTKTINGEVVKCPGRLKPKVVDGGVVLQETPYNLRP